MRSRYFMGLGSSGFHRLHYMEWAESRGAIPVMCVHGLTQNARAFDELARTLSLHRWVACADVAGRGRSDWLGAASAYGYPQYMADANALIARLGADSVDWVGTSMGGLIGMMMAALPASPIRRLVLNDIGPFLGRAPIARIADYVGAGPRSYADVAALEAHMRKAYEPFGPLTDVQWRNMAAHACRDNDDGSVSQAYDPAIGTAFIQTAPADINLWSVWDRIQCPVLVLRGAVSDVLEAATAAEMTTRGPKAKLIEFAGIGHAPALLERDQIDPIVEFLARDAMAASLQETTPNTRQ